MVTNTANQKKPYIRGDIVVWEDYRNGNPDVYAKNLMTGQEFAVATGPAAQTSPATSGPVVVWQDNRNGNWDIYGKNLITNVEFPVVTGAAAQTNPDITPNEAGDLVVWTDWRNGNSDIYGAQVTWPLAVENVRASPNPFYPIAGTTISYTLSKAANATLLVLDGELGPVRTMGPVSRTVGANAFLWDGRTQAGQVISSGLYVPVVVASAGAESAYGYTLATADNGVAPVVSNPVASPNPIVPPGGTAVSYQVSKGSVQVLLVLDAQGGEVRRIVAGYKKGGPVSFFWDGRNQAGSYVPSGNYILVPVAVDLLGRVGYNFTFVQVGTGPAMSALDVKKVASAWVEAHRDELAGFIKKAMNTKLSGLP